MTTPRDPDRLIREYLTEGPTELPDRTYDALRGDIDRTRQRVVFGPWRESHMNNIAKVALALTAVTVLAVTGLNLLPGASGPGAAPSPTPSPSPAASPTPGPTPSPREAYMPPTGALVAGTYDAVSEVDLIPFSFTVADGWNSEGWYLTKSDVGTDRPDAYVMFTPVGNLLADPCESAPASPAVGPTVEDLALAAAALPGIDASPTLDATLDGRAGRLVEYVIPKDITCASGRFTIWRDPVGGGLWENAPFGETVRMWILDVDGSRFVVTGVYHSTTSAADRAELQGIVDSLTFGD